MTLRPVALLVAMIVLAVGGRARALDCTTVADCPDGWVCDTLSGTCWGPAGAECAHAGDCQGNICAGGHCCADPCAYSDPECGGTCDETGACTYPPLYTGCHCDGGTATCWHGDCQCEQSDAGPAADAPVDEPNPATLCGCHAADRPAGAGLALLAVALLAARGRPRVRAVRTH
jgi:MYXO-CTERM domain-containing protein